MALVLSAPSAQVDRIYTTHGEAVDRSTLKMLLEELAQKGRLTSRDEQLLELLRELNVLSLDQVRRLFWPEGKGKTAYRRLGFLLKQHLLAGARVPRSGMVEWGLPVSKVYALGPGGRLWLKEEVTNGHISRYLKRDQVLHDLLVAELCVRLTEAAVRRGSAWSLTWAGEQAASYYPRPDEAPLVVPDGLSILRQQRGGKTATLPFFVELDASREGHGRLSSDWGRKVVGYDRFAEQWKSHPELGGLPNFPLVAVVTHGEQRLLNLVGAISEQRRQPVL